MFNAFACRLFDRFHHLVRSRLMDHMSGIRKSMKFALLDVIVQSSRLSIDVDNSVVFTGNDDNRHLQFCVSITEMKGVRDHQRRF